MAVVERRNARIGGIFDGLLAVGGESSNVFFFAQYESEFARFDGYSMDVWFFNVFLREECRLTSVAKKSIIRLSRELKVTDW